jgi:cell division septum initiation protein DivIVA
MLDQIRRDIQALLDELLGEIDRLRRALAALTSRESEPDRSGRAAPAGSAAGESVARSPRAATRRAARTRTASVPPRPSAPAAGSSAAAPTSTCLGSSQDKGKRCINAAESLSAP